MKETNAHVRQVCLAVLAIVGIATMSNANHLSDCVIESADPATYNVVAYPSVGPVPGRTFYVEERTENDIGVTLPLWGLASGGGTWISEETNDWPGLQRNARGLPGGTCYPADDPCIITSDTNLHDQACDHGNDAMVGGFEWDDGLYLQAGALRGV